MQEARDLPATPCFECFAPRGGFGLVGPTGLAGGTRSQPAANVSQRADAGLPEARREGPSECRRLALVACAIDTMARQSSLAQEVTHIDGLGPLTEDVLLPDANLETGTVMRQSLRMLGSFVQPVRDRPDNQRRRHTDYGVRLAFRPLNHCVCHGAHHDMGCQFSMAADMLHVHVFCDRPTA